MVRIRITLSIPVEKFSHITKQTPDKNEDRKLSSDREEISSIQTKINQ